jgi:DNA-binding response OmpR family regulator
MGKETKPLYEFGPFRVDARERRLLREGVVVPLTPKVFDILLVLVENGSLAIFQPSEKRSVKAVIILITLRPSRGSATASWLK